MLGNNYIKINGEAIPNPVSLREANTNKENILITEDGFEMVDIVRLEKRAFTCRFQVSSTWKERLKTLCLASSSTVQIGSDASFSARCRFNSAQLEKNSEFAQRTNGLWTCDVIITEL